LKPSVAKGFSDELAKLGGVSAVLFREPAKVETDPALDKMVKQMPSVQRGKSGRTLDTAMRSRYRDDGVAHNLSSHVGWTSGGQDGSGEAPSAGLRS
jgi:hypothetical protein